MSPIVDQGDLALFREFVEHAEPNYPKSIEKDFDDLRHSFWSALNRDLGNQGFPRLISMFTWFDVPLPAGLGVWEGKATYMQVVEHLENLDEEDCYDPECNHESVCPHCGEPLDV